jgi:uncharacterized protein
MMPKKLIFFPCYRHKNKNLLHLIEIAFNFLRIMFSRFLPKEVGFFDFFDKQAEIIVESAKTFHFLTLNPLQIEASVEKIKLLESQADEVTHQCIEALHKTFITPFERDDIRHLTCSLDNIIDEIDAAADCLVVYKISEISPFTKELAEILVQTTLEVHAVIKALRDLSHEEAIRSICSKINKLENDADLILRNAIAKLFEEESDIRMLIKWKEIYEHLENATDHCDNVANIVEGIILEYA